MALVRIGSLAALPDGQVMEAEVGENTYAICRLGGKLYAYQGVCPHAEGPLGQGTIENGRLVCPLHGWEYDCLTGVNDFDDTVKLASFPVRAEGDDILLEIP